MAADSGLRRQQLRRRLRRGRPAGDHQLGRQVPALRRRWQADPSVDRAVPALRPRLQPGGGGWRSASTSRPRCGSTRATLGRCRRPTSAASTTATLQKPRLVDRRHDAVRRRHAITMAGAPVIAWDGAGGGPRRALPAGSNTVMSLRPLPGGELLVAAQDPWLGVLAPTARARWQQRAAADGPARAGATSASRPTACWSSSATSFGAKAASASTCRR